DLRRQNTARRRAGVREPDRITRSGRGAPGNSDGRGGGWRLAGRSDARCAHRREGPGDVGFDLLRRLWHQPDAIFIFEEFLAVRAAVVAGGVFRNAANGIVEYADSGHGA